MTKRFSVYQQVADFKPVKVETFRTAEQAQARVRTYERQDKYDVQVSGYTFPHGMPKYFVKEA